MLKGLSLASFVVIAGLAATPAFARVDVMIGVAPPAPMVEVVPEPRVGFVWAPGYWEWRDHAHVWVAGRWIHERPGYRWVGDRWDHDGDRYRHIRGHWER